MCTILINHTHHLRVRQGVACGGPLRSPTTSGNGHVIRRLPMRVRNKIAPALLEGSFALGQFFAHNRRNHLRQFPRQFGLRHDNMVLDPADCFCQVRTFFVRFATAFVRSRTAPSTSFTVRKVCRETVRSPSASCSSTEIRRLNSAISLSSPIGLSSYALTNPVWRSMGLRTASSAAISGISFVWLLKRRSTFSRISAIALCLRRKHTAFLEPHAGHLESPLDHKRRCLIRVVLLVLKANNGIGTDPIHIACRLNSIFREGINCKDGRLKQPDLLLPAIISSGHVLRFLAVCP